MGTFVVFNRTFNWQKFRFRCLNSVGIVFNGPESRVRWYFGLTITFLFTSVYVYTVDKLWGYVNRMEFFFVQIMTVPLKYSTHAMHITICRTFSLFTSELFITKNKKKIDNIENKKAIVLFWRWILVFYTFYIPSCTLHW